MDFNKYSSSLTAQEFYLVKQAIADALKPTSEPQLITIPATGSVVIEGEYSGFSIRIPDSYTDIIKVKVNDGYEFGMGPGYIYTLDHGVLEYGKAAAQSRRNVIDELHSMQKYSVITKLEFSVTPVSETPMGLETDLVLIK